MGGGLHLSCLLCAYHITVSSSLSSAFGRHITDTSWIGVLSRTVVLLSTYMCFRLVGRIYVLKHPYHISFILFIKDDQCFFFFVLLCLFDRYPHSNCPCRSWGGHKAQCHFFLIIKGKLLEPSPPVSVTDNLALDTLWIFLNIQSKHSTHYKV